MSYEEIMEALQEIIDKLSSKDAENLTEDEIKELEDKANELEEEKKAYEAKAEKRNAALEKAQKTLSVRAKFDDEGVEERKMEDEKKLYRSAFLKSLMKRELTQEETRAYTSASNSGGAVIPTELAADIISKAREKAPILKYITLLNVKGNVKFAVEGTNTDAALHTENASITGASDTMVEVSLTAYEIAKLIQISKSVMTMSIDAFEAWLVDALAERIVKMIVFYIIKGNGSSQPTGIDVANTWGATNSITVAKTSSLTAANVQELIGLLKSGYDANAIFLMSKKTLFTDFMPLQDNSKNKIVTNEGNNYFVYGYPVVLEDEVTAHEAYLLDGTKYVGNLSEDVTVVSDFDINTNSFKFLGTAMFDGKMAIAEAVVKLVKATT